MVSLTNSDSLSEYRWYTLSPDCLLSMVKILWIVIPVSFLVHRSLSTEYLQLTNWYWTSNVHNNKFYFYIMSAARVRRENNAICYLHNHVRV